MRKAADAVAVHALNRAVAKRSKASSGLVVDIVASATINAVHTWPMETDSPLVRRFCSCCGQTAMGAHGCHKRASVHSSAMHGS